MAQTDFRAVLQGSNELDITVTGRTSGRSLYLPRMVCSGWRQALSDPGKGIRYRLVQKLAQEPDHPPGGAWEDVHRKRSFSHRRGAARQGP